MQCENTSSINTPNASQLHFSLLNMHCKLQLDPELKPQLQYQSMKLVKNEE